MPRRGGGWLSQRDERKCTVVRPLVSSSRAQPRDLSCRQENRTYEEVRHSKSYEVRCLPLPSHFLSDRCARKISRFARNDNTGKGGTLFSALETLSSSLFHAASALSAPSGHLPLEGKALSVVILFPHMRVFALTMREKRHSRIVAFPIGEGFVLGTAALSQMPYFHSVQTKTTLRRLALQSGFWFYYSTVTDFARFLGLSTSFPLLIEV